MGALVELIALEAAVAHRQLAQLAALLQARRAEMVLPHLFLAHLQLMLAVAAGVAITPAVEPRAARAVLVAVGLAQQVILVRQ
jgi:hypothetical protein